MLPMYCDIYGLKDPVDGQVHYIGKSNNPAQRLQEHIEDAKTNAARVKWIAALLAIGLSPELVILEKVLRSEFILYARASGLPNWQIAIYALRNAFAPSLTLFAILLAFMLGGAVLIETVFSWGGLGQYSVRSILAFDYPAIQGVILIITLFSLLVYLLLDVIHALLDPRVTLH